MGLVLRRTDAIWNRRTSLGVFMSHSQEDFGDLCVNAGVPRMVWIGQSNKQRIHKGSLSILSVRMQNNVTTASTDLPFPVDMDRRPFGFEVIETTRRILRLFGFVRRGLEDERFGRLWSHGQGRK